MLGRAVVEAATRLGHDVHAASRADLDITDAAAVRGAVLGARRAGGRQLRRVHGRRRRRGRLGATPRRSTARARATSRRRRRRPAPRSSTSRRTTSSTAPSASRGSSPTRPARSASTARRSSAASTPSRRRRPGTRSSARRGSSARAARTSSTRCSALGAQRDEVAVVTDQVGCPTWTGHLARALVELAERPDETGIHHIAGAGSCSWNELALELFDRAGDRVPRAPRVDRRSSRGRRGARRTACSAPSARGRSSWPPWREGVATTSRRG